MNLPSGDIGVGIIGCGGRIRLVLSQVQKSFPQIKLRAVCDPSAASVEAARNQFGSDVKACARPDELAALPSVQWVMIGSWNCFHCDHILAAIEAGKNVFAEKPLATTFDQVLRILKGYRQSSVIFSFGFPLRHSPHVKKVQEIIASGRLGKIISAEFNETLKFNHGGYIAADWRRLRANGGTFLLEKCCHDVDIMNWIVGSLPVKAASFGGTNFFLPENEHHIHRIGRHPDGWEAYRKHASIAPLNPFTSDKDTVDNQVAILEYANGVRVSFHANTNAAIAERRSYFCGSEGSLRHNINEGYIEVARIGFDSKIERIETGITDGHDFADEAMSYHVGKCIASGEAPEVGIDEAVKSALSCLGVDRAHDTQTVCDLIPMWREAGIAVA